MLEYLRLEAPAGHVVTLHDVAAPGGINALGAAVTQVVGLVGVPGPRSAVREAVERHGSIDRSRWLNARGPTIDGELWGDSDAAYQARVDAVSRALLATLEAPGVLTWKRAGPDGRELRALVKHAGGFDPPLVNAARLLDYQVSLSQPDPRAYSQQLRTLIGEAPATGGGGLVFPFTFPLAFTLSGGGSVVVDNQGTAPAPVLIRLFGHAVAPTIRVLETGEQIVLNGEVPAGSFYAIDTAAPSVRLNGELSRMDQLDAQRSTFFEVPAQSARTLQLIASAWDQDAHLEVDVRDAYASG